MNDHQIETSKSAKQDRQVHPASIGTDPLNTNGGPRRPPRFCGKKAQLCRAVELGLGVGSPKDIEIVTGEDESRRYGDKLREILRSEAG